MFDEKDKKQSGALLAEKDYLNNSCAFNHYFKNYLRDK